MVLSVAAIHEQVGVRGREDYHGSVGDLAGEFGGRGQRWGGITFEQSIGVGISVRQSFDVAVGVSLQQPFEQSIAVGVCFRFSVHQSIGVGVRQSVCHAVRQPLVFSIDLEVEQPVYVCFGNPFHFAVAIVNALRQPVFVAVEYPVGVSIANIFEQSIVNAVNVEFEQSINFSFSELSHARHYSNMARPDAIRIY